MAVCLTLALGATAYYIGAGGGGFDNEVFPERAPTIIAIPNAEQGEDQRLIEPWDDGRTPRRAVITFKNGDLGYEHFREDGTLSRREIFYPSADRLLRKLKLRAEFAADGVTYLTDFAYTADGKLVRTGVRDAEGRYTVEEFFQDGETVARHWAVDRDGKPLVQRIYSAGGQLIEEGLKKDNSFDVAVYSETSGALVKRRQIQMFTDRLIEFYPNGETPKTDILTEMFRTTVVSYLPDGSIEQERVFTNYQMVVTVYRNGVKSYQQKWHLLNPEAAGPEDDREYRLMEASVFNAKGEVVWLTYMTESIGLPWLIEERPNPSDPTARFKMRVFNDDGCLIKAGTRVGEYGSIEVEQEFDPAKECIKEEIPAYLSRDIPYVVPPRPVPPPEPAHP